VGGQRLRRSEGFALIEVLAASLVLAIGVIGTLLVFSVSGRTALGAQTREQATSVGQREIERIKAMTYSDIGLTSLPAHAATGVPAGQPTPDNPANPNYYVTATNPPNLLIKSNWHDSSSAVAAGTPAAGEPLLDGGTIAPGPTTFTDGKTSGKIYRYVTWHVETCGGSTAALCPAKAASPTTPAIEAGTQATKRVTVAVVLDAPGQRLPRPMYVSTVVSDPDAGPLGATVPPTANPGSSGTQITAQTFFLYDTPCTSSIRLDSTGPHATHDTSRTTPSCSSLPAPDLMGPEAPPSHAEDVIVPVDDISTELTRTAPAGLVLRRISSCPTSYSDPADSSKIHTWATAPFATAFKTPTSGARTALTAWSRTVDGVAAGATLCLTMRSFSNPNTILASTTYTLAQWPTDFQPVSFAFDHSAFTVAAGDRLLLTLSVQATSGSDIEIVYDHPDDRSFLTVTTTTPLTS
jgi:Tfp pilus assembly protein PilV